MSDANSSPGTYEAFISYSTKNQKWANAVCAVLERNRIRCWIAPRDITPGMEWGAAIIQGIDECRVVVLIFSSDANDSAQVRREVERAISKGLAILPFRIENVSPAGAMEYALGNTHWLDGFNPPLEQHLEVLAKSVATLLGKSPIGSGSVPGAAAPYLEEIPEAKTLAADLADSQASRKWIVAAVAVAAVALVVIAGLMFAMTRRSGAGDAGDRAAAQTKGRSTQSEAKDQDPTETEASGGTGRRSPAAAFFADEDRRLVGGITIGRITSRVVLNIEEIDEQDGGWNGTFTGELVVGFNSPNFSRTKMKGEWKGSTVKMSGVEVLEGQPLFPVEYTGVIGGTRFHGTYQNPDGVRSGTFDLKSDPKGSSNTVKKKGSSQPRSFDFKSESRPR